MVDKLVIDAQDKLKEFREAWSKRGYDFLDCGMPEASQKAFMLSYESDMKMLELNKLLEEDKRLDKLYDKIKKKIKA